jgi:two-component sensor histidine kinase
MRMEGRVSMLASTVNDADALGGSGLPILQVIAAGPAGIGGETTLLIDRAEGDREGEQPASVTLFPLRRNGLSYGTLLVAHRPERPPDRDERLLIREVCARTAAALAGLVTRAPAGAKRQDLALHGLRHGQRNLLALVRTIARQLLPLANSSQDFAERFDARLASLARTEALMLDAGRGPIWFRDVVAMELGAAGACGPHVHADGPDVVLSRACVQATALAVYELASNAVEHGALSARGGSLALHWQVRSVASSTYLTIRWIETCPGHVILPGAAGVPGFGRQLLEQALPYQFGARVAFNIEPSGLCCVIDLPLCQ